MQNYIIKRLGYGLGTVLDIKPYISIYLSKV